MESLGLTLWCPTKPILFVCLINDLFPILGFSFIFIFRLLVNILSDECMINYYSRLWDIVVVYSHSFN